MSNVKKVIKPIIQIHKLQDGARTRHSTVTVHCHTYNHFLALGITPFCQGMSLRRTLQRNNPIFISLLLLRFVREY